MRRSYTRANHCRLLPGILPWLDDCVTSDVTSAMAVKHGGYPWKIKLINVFAVVEQRSWNAGKKNAKRKILGRDMEIKTKYHITNRAAAKGNRKIVKFSNFDKLPVVSRSIGGSCAPSKNCHDGSHTLVTALEPTHPHYPLQQHHNTHFSFCASFPLYFSQ